MVGGKISMRNFIGKENTHCRDSRKEKSNTDFAEMKPKPICGIRVAERIDRYCAGLSERENQ